MEKVDQSAGSDQKRAKYRMGLVVAGLLLFARALMGALLLFARRFEQGAKELQTPSKKGSEAMVEGSGDVPEEASDARLQWSEWAAYAACAWALTFAAVHLYRALGGTVGLPPGFTVAMKPALFVIDVLAVPLCVVGALLTLSLVRPWGRFFPRRLLLACAWAACALLILHSVPTLIGDGLVIAGLRAGDLSVPERWSLFVYEPWFFMGGVLYGAAALDYGRRSPRPSRPGP